MKSVNDAEGRIPPLVHEYVVCEIHAVSIDASNIQREGSEYEL